MKIALISIACLVLLTNSPAQETKHAAKSGWDASTLEAKVRKAWQDFKNKDKTAFAATLADGFCEVEEDGNGFGDKAAILAMIDAFELNSYALKDFKVTPVGKDATLVTYRAQYDGKVGGQPVQANTAYGELWVHQNNAWKLLYVQETNVK